MKRTALIIFLIYIIAGSACLKKNYDEPPDKRGADPGLKITHSIAALKTLPPYTMISNDIVISGIVVMDDKSGNYFRKIVLQDTSGGIELLIDQNNLYTDYPVGRKIYVACKGLYLGAFADNPQLGYTPDATGFVSGIPALLAGQYVVKGSYSHPVIPDTFTLSELKDVTAMQRYLNTLVALKNMEFDSASIGKPYAEQAVVAPATQRLLLDCIERNVQLRTSAYARFQPYLIPSGNGTLTAIYTRSYNKAQLVIRDTADVAFYGLRCSQVVQTLLQQHFSAQDENEEIALDGWQNIPETGAKKYRKGGAGTGSYARITAFGGGTPAVVTSWLITPAVDLTGKLNARLSFKTKDGYDNGATLKIGVSTNYDGSGDPGTANWTLLPATVSSGNTAGYAPEWTVVYLPLRYSVPVHIAFKYEGGTGKTTTFDLTDVKVISE